MIALKIISFHQPTYLSIVLFAVVIPLKVSAASVISYEVQGLVNQSALPGQGGQIFNLSSDVLGSGNALTNTLNLSNGAYVDFEVSTSGQNFAYNHLRVSVDDIVNGNSIGSGNFMLAQTSNSQGLTDSGTLSFLMTGNGANSATLTFEWFEPNGLFDTPVVESRFITSYDIDFDQYNSFLTSDLSGVVLSETTDLQRMDNGDYSTFYSDGSSAVVADSEHAVSVLTQDLASQEIQVGKNGSGNVLFMFEFRNPSQNLDDNFSPTQAVSVAPGAPSPPVYALALFAVVAALKSKVQIKKAKL